MLFGRGLKGGGGVRGGKIWGGLGMREKERGGGVWEGGSRNEIKQDGGDVKGGERDIGGGGGWIDRTEK